MIVTLRIVQTIADIHPIYRKRHNHNIGNDIDAGDVQCKWRALKAMLCNLHSRGPQQPHTSTTLEQDGEKWRYRPGYHDPYNRPGDDVKGFAAKYSTVEEQNW